MKGWVYVITNAAMPSLVKVGFSTKDPELRAAELGNTGSPHPYTVEYEMLIEEPYQIEQATHKFMSHVREGKEWFKCSVEEAVLSIRNISNGQQISETYKRLDREKILAVEQSVQKRIAQQNAQNEATRLSREAEILKLHSDYRKEEFDLLRDLPASQLSGIPWFINRTERHLSIIVCLYFIFFLLCVISGSKIKTNDAFFLAKIFSVVIYVFWFIVGDALFPTFSQWVTGKSIDENIEVANRDAQERLKQTYITKLNELGSTLNLEFARKLPEPEQIK